MKTRTRFIFFVSSVLLITVSTINAATSSAGKSAAPSPILLIKIKTSSGYKLQTAPCAALILMQAVRNHAKKLDTHDLKALQAEFNSDEILTSSTLTLFSDVTSNDANIINKEVTSLTEKYKCTTAINKSVSLIQTVTCPDAKNQVFGAFIEKNIITVKAAVANNVDKNQPAPHNVSKARSVATNRI